MIQINYKLNIIGSDLETLIKDFNENKIKYTEIDKNDISVIINSIEKNKLITSVITQNVIYEKWNMVFESVLYDVFHKEFSNFSNVAQKEILKIKKHKRLEIIVNKTLNSYLCTEDNNVLNLDSFLMFNMSGFEDYLKDEFQNFDLDKLNIIDDLNKELLEIWESNGIHKKDFESLFLMKNNNSYILLTKQEVEIDYLFFTKKMGFDENDIPFGNEEKKYTAIILNVSRFMNTQNIYVDKNTCKEMLDLLISNLYFEGNHANIIASDKHTIRKLLDSNFLKGN